MNWLKKKMKSNYLQINLFRCNNLTLIPSAFLKPNVFFARDFAEEDGSPSIHIGAQKGEIRYPRLFYDRLKRWKNLELLKTIEEDPFSSFEEKETKQEKKKGVKEL